MSTPEVEVAPEVVEASSSPIVPPQPLVDYFHRKHMHEDFDALIEKEFSARCEIARRYHVSFSSLVDHYLEYLGGMCSGPPQAQVDRYEARHYEHESRMSPSRSPHSPRSPSRQMTNREASPDCTARSDYLATSFHSVETPFDLSLTLHRKDVRVRAMEVAYDDEYRRTEEFRMREHRRTVAAWKRAEALQQKAMTRKITDSLKHSSYVDRQRQKEANEKRQKQREADEAARGRQELINTQKRSHQLAKFRSDRMAREAIQAAADGLSQAKGVLDKEILHTMQVEAARKQQGIATFEASTKNALHKRMLYEETYNQSNCKGAEMLDRTQLASFGAEDRSRVIRPEGLKSTIHIPVEELSRVPKFKDPTGSSHPVHKPVGVARRPKPTAGPMDARTYDRLCNVSSPLSAPAIRDKVWGSASSPSDLSSYYMVRAPPNVGWKR